MRLNAPTKIVFFISLLIALIALVVALGLLPMIPVPAFWILAAAFILLALSCVLSGL